MIERKKEGSDERRKGWVKVRVNQVVNQVGS